MSTPLILFIIFIAITLGITFWASSHNRTKAEFMTADRQITGFQNGWAAESSYPELTVRANTGLGAEV